MHTILTFSTVYDAPFDRIEITFRYHSGSLATGPSLDFAGELGEAASVEVLHAVVTVAGQRHEAPDWLAQALGELLRDDLLQEGRDHVEEAREARRYGRVAA